MGFLANIQDLILQNAAFTSANQSLLLLVTVLMGQANHFPELAPFLQPSDPMVTRHNFYGRRFRKAFYVTHNNYSQLQGFC